MRIKMSGGGITINGKAYKGNSVSISNDKIVIDGVVQGETPEQEVNVIVNGNVEKIENSCGTVTAQAVGSIKTQSGDIECANVSGSVKTMSGDVTCGRIGGGVSTMSGDISHA